jgi:hypothetical protein
MQDAHEETQLHARFARIIRFHITLALLGCSSSTIEPGETPDTLGPGRWGSADMALVITDTTATTRFDFCADGTIKVPIFVDPDGRFEASGTYVRQIGPSVQARSARYVGLWRPASLTIAVFLSDSIGPTGSDVVGPFDLRPNESGPPIRICPIEH